MRFAALQGGGASDYAAAGKKVANEAVNTFAVQRKSGPDYGKIAETGMRARSAEKRAGMEAGAQVAKAGINAYTEVNKVKIKEDTKAEVRGIGNKMRKAGAIGALGGLVGAGFLAFRDNEEGRERPDGTAAMKEVYENYKNTRDGLIDGREANRTEYVGSEYTPPNFSSGSNSNSNSSSTSNSGTSGSSSGTAGKGSNPSDTGSRYMSFLTQSGLSKEQAAALTGHMDVESDGFRAHEEYAPNRYGTRGLGHLQWTNTPGSSRRTNFETFSSNKGLDPKSFEASSQFLLSEMQGNHGQHWTNGGSYDGFLQTKSIEEASRYLQNNYIRPGVPHTERRLNSAHSAYNSFNP